MKSFFEITRPLPRIGSMFESRSQTPARTRSQNLLHTSATKLLVARLMGLGRSVDQPSPDSYQLMPPKRSNTLTQAELRLMRVLWDRGESTVADMVTATSDEGELAYTSVLTTIRILETKGYVSHRQEGRAFLYCSNVGELEAGRSEVRHVLQRFFGNSRERLLLSLLGDDEISPDELKRLKRSHRRCAQRCAGRGTRGRLDGSALSLHVARSPHGRQFPAFGNLGRRCSCSLRTPLPAPASSPQRSSSLGDLDERLPAVAAAPVRSLAHGARIHRKFRPAPPRAFSSTLCGVSQLPPPGCCSPQ